MEKGLYRLKVTQYGVNMEGDGNTEYCILYDSEKDIAVGISQDGSEMDPYVHIEDTTSLKKLLSGESKPDKDGNYFPRIVDFEHELLEGSKYEPLRKNMEEIRESSDKFKSMREACLELKISDSE